MELLLISTYAAICVAVFTILRIPLNRWTVPTASIGGIVMVFALIQVLNYYHPYSGESRQFTTSEQIIPSVTGKPLTVEGPNLIAWFNQNNRLRLNQGSVAEVTFDSIPGKVFAAKVDRVLPPSAVNQAWAQNQTVGSSINVNPSQIPVRIEIIDPSYYQYALHIPSGSHAQAAVYGEHLDELALVRKTLLRMSAWMNYVSLFS